MVQGASIVALPGGGEPPHDFVLEQALLGSLLVNNAGYAAVARDLRPEHFADPAHGEIFKAIAQRIDAGDIADPRLLLGQLGAIELPDGITMAGYLGRLAGAATVHSTDTGDYGREITKLASRRLGMKAGLRLLDGIRAGEQLQDVITDAERMLHEARGGVTGRRKGLRSFTFAVEAAMDEAHRAHTSGGIIGLSTGLRSLDRIIGGMSGGELIVIAGRPSMGKTSAAVVMAVNVATPLIEQDPDGVVAVFSLEMPEQQLASRVLSHGVNRAWKRYRSGETAHADMERLELAAVPARRLPIMVDDTAGLSIGDARARLQRLRVEKKPVLVVVDYLQLMKPDQARRDGNRVQEVTEITAGLKAIAKDFDVPVVALSQVSRKCEEREDKRPTLADLRESGSIEQDADVVIFVYRDEYYITRSEPKDQGQKWSDWATRRDAARGKVELIVEKQRNGPTGTAKLLFDQETTWITDPPHDDEPAQENML